MIAPRQSCQNGNALHANDATFLTTPKEGSSKEVCEVKRQKKVHKHWKDNVTAFLGLALALHQTVFLFIVGTQVASFSAFETFVRLMNMVICLGLYWVNLSFFASKFHVSRESFCLAIGQRRDVLCGVLLVALTNCLVVMLYLQGYDEMRESSTIMTPTALGVDPSAPLLASA